MVIQNNYKTKTIIILNYIEETERLAYARADGNFAKI